MGLKQNINNNNTRTTNERLLHMTSGDLSHKIKSMKMDCGMAAMFIELSLLGKENDFDKQKGNYSVPKCSASHDE